MNVTQLHRLALTTAALTALCSAMLLPATADAADPEYPATRSSRTYSIEASPMSPLLRIYVLQFTAAFSPRDEFIVGASYMNIHFDSGETRSPGAIVGLRHYFWKQLHIEYQLWPAYDSFLEKTQNKVYKGFDLWNEARIGYRFDIELSNKTSLYVIPQWAVGFGLYGTNKPQSFKDEAKEQPFFAAPLVFVGLGF